MRGYRTSKYEGGRRARGAAHPLAGVYGGAGAGAGAGGVAREKNVRYLRKSTCICTSYLAIIKRIVYASSRRVYAGTVECYYNVGHVVSITEKKGTR